jgi:hypothetical protein
MIGVHLGNPAVGVADPVGDLHNRHACRGALGDEGVAEVVEADLAETGTPHGGLIAARDEIPRVEGLPASFAKTRSRSVGRHADLCRSKQLSEAVRIGALRGCSQSSDNQTPSLLPLHQPYTLTGG